MNYFITLEATSEEAYNELMSFLNKEEFPISELGITSFDNNQKTRKQRVDTFNKNLLNHFNKIKQTVIANSME